MSRPAELVRELVREEIRAISAYHVPDASGMVKLDAEQQQMLVSAEPGMFVPVKGTWGLRGATSVRLAAADARTMLSALTMAWRNVTAPKARKPKRA